MVGVGGGESGVKLGPKVRALLCPHPAGIVAEEVEERAVDQLEPVARAVASRATNWRETKERGMAHGSTIGSV